VDQHLLENRINLENLPELIDDLAQNGIEDLIITGGEPLMNMELLELAIGTAKRIGMSVSVDSNGTLLNESIIDRLESSALDHLYLSSYFLKTINEEILTYARMKLSLRVIHVVTKHNAGQLGDFVDFLKQNKIAFPILNPVFMYKDNKNYENQSLASLQDNDLQNVIEIIKQVYRQNNLKFPHLLEDFYLERKASFPTFCHMGEADLVIYSNGDVFPCFHRRDLYAGNVFEDDLQIIIQKNRDFAVQTKAAQCFGEYCLSHFTN
jgi:MoaA/NifB/PqqE/SkfB family radical SAM enzyme